MPYKIEDLKFPGYDQPFSPEAAKAKAQKQPVRSSILDMLRPKEVVEEKEEPVEVEVPKVQAQPKPVKKPEPIKRPEPEVIPQPEPKPAEEIMQKIVKKQPKKQEEIMVKQPEAEEPFLDPSVLNEHLVNGLKDECEYEYMPEPKYEGYGGAVEKAKDLLKIAMLTLAGVVVTALVVRGIMLLFSI